MKDIDEIAEQIRNTDPFTVQKRKELICELGGGKIKNGRLYADPAGFEPATDKIRKAIYKLEKRDNEENYEDFLEEINDAFS